MAYTDINIMPDDVNFVPDATAEMTIELNTHSQEVAWLRMKLDKSKITVFVERTTKTEIREFVKSARIAFQDLDEWNRKRDHK